jgi:hypothetical protein
LVDAIAGFTLDGNAFARKNSWGTTGILVEVGRLESDLIINCLCLEIVRIAIRKTQAILLVLFGCRSFSFGETHM